ncbi:hypothetical protein ACFL5V_02045 [Fibrobacterota bacterium]
MYRLGMSPCNRYHGGNGRGLGVSEARDFTTLDNWKRGTSLTEIFRTISRGIEGTQMRSFDNLSPWDRFALVHKVASFASGSQRPVDSDTDIERLVIDFQLDKVRKPRKTLPIEKAMEIMVREAAVE